MEVTICIIRRFQVLKCYLCLCQLLEYPISNFLLLSIDLEITVLRLDSAYRRQGDLGFRLGSSIIFHPFFIRLQQGTTD